MKWKVLRFILGFLAFTCFSVFLMNCEKKPSNAQSATGKEVFKVHCQSCHGQWGEGDGPYSDATQGKPRDYVTEGFKYGHDFPSVVKSVKSGFPESGMPGYSDKLSESEIGAVAKYVLSLYMRR